MADILEKALPRKEAQLKYPVLRELQKRTEELYAKQLDAMLVDVGEVLTKNLVKPTKKKVKQTPVVQKALAPQDFTQPIAEKDELKYEQVKAELMSLGYESADFEPGGIFDGWSTNELIDFTRGKQDE